MFAYNVDLMKAFHSETVNQNKQVLGHGIYDSNRKVNNI